MSPSRPRRAAPVAIVGAGVIAPAYARTIERFAHMELAAFVDTRAERAEELAGRHGAVAATLDEVLADDRIETLVNLTPPSAHAAVTAAAIRRGKSVFTEKPLGVTFGEGVELVELAATAGVRLGCAPDTFLGSGLQTARATIDRGDIGVPLAATGFMMGSGPEWWHPDPAFFYAKGAGPLADMGPYYLTALIQLLGPARAVMASAVMSRPQRVIGSEPLRGQTIDVEVATHVTTLLEFAEGAAGTVITSFDVAAAKCRNIEVYGSEATLSVPDPNTFGGPVQIRARGDDAWRDVPLMEPTIVQSRGIGLADMVWAQRSGRPHRASADLALHVLEIIDAATASSDRGMRVELTTTCTRSAPLPSDLTPDRFDD